MVVFQPFLSTSLCACHNREVAQNRKLEQIVVGQKNMEQLVPVAGLVVVVRESAGLELLVVE